VLHIYVQKQHYEAHQALFEKVGRREGEIEIQWTAHMYGITTMKCPHFMNAYQFKNTIKLF
jgi:hypothetical protein